jgi:urate oxidase
MSEVVLTAHQYGKAENRVVRIVRDTDRHQIVDLNVTSQLRGDFAAAHLEGDNSHVVATDTQKNTIFAFAKDGIASPEEFLLRLAAHFTGEFDWVSGGRFVADEYGWARINDHDHAFYRSGAEVRSALVVRDGDLDTVISGFSGLTVLKSTASGFVGFPRDRYTTLPEATDRVLATSLSTKWRYDADQVAAKSIDYTASYAAIKDTILTTFTQGYSKALQQTLYAMARAVIEQHPAVVEIRFSCPNKHHFAVDLSPFGLDNPNEVFLAADRPYGLIEAAVQRRGAPSAEPAWAGVMGFC